MFTIIISERSILRVNNAICNEAERIYYTRNTFKTMGPSALQVARQLSTVDTRTLTQIIHSHRARHLSRNLKSFWEISYIERKEDQNRQIQYSQVISQLNECCQNEVLKITVVLAFEGQKHHTEEQDCDMSRQFICREIE
jgi:hypothetical protein